MNNLPRFLVTVMVSTITFLLLLNVVSDIFVASYSGYPTTVVLCGLFGTALGADRVVRRALNKKEGEDE